LKEKQQHKKSERGIEEVQEYNMSENNNIRQRQQERSSFRNYQYLFIAAAIATAIAGIVHLYMPLAHPRMLGNIPMATFFLDLELHRYFGYCL